ncbi:MAG: cell division protein FtsA [candidate division WOR-3 bacterium]
MKDYVIAIDLGSGYIKAGLGFYSNNEIEILAISEVPSYGIRYGLINNTQKASESIRSAIKNLNRITNFEKFEYLPVVVGINGKGIFTAKSSNGMISIRNNKPIDENDIKRVIEQAKVGAVIPSEHEIIYVHPNSFIVDNHKNIKNPIGMFGRRLEVEAYIVSVEILMLKNIKMVLNSAGISDAQIYLNAIAQKYGFLDEDEHSEGVIIIDIGKQLTTLTLWNGDALNYLAVYEQGLSSVIDEISRDTLISKKTCENVLKSINIPNMYQLDYEDLEIEIMDERKNQVVRLSSRRISSIILDVISAIFTRIQSDIEKTGFLKSVPTPSIYLTGGIAEIKGIEQIAENIFNLPVYIGKISLKVNDKSYLSPRYITLAGLIKLYFESPKDKISKVENNKSFLSRLFSKLKEMME